MTVARVERDRRHIVAGNLVDGLAQPIAHRVPLEIPVELDHRTT
jgi:hypothetical protein